MQLPCRRVRRPRRVGVDRGRRPLVRRRWRRGYGVSRPCTARDASQATATTSHATTVPASMRDAFSVPSCPANVPEVSRGRRPAVSDVHFAPHWAHGASGSTRPRRPSERHGASVPYAGASPAAVPPYSRIAQLRFGTWASPSTSYGCRARTGFPPAVWSPSLSGWLPTTPPQGGSHMAATIAPAPKRHQRKIVSTLAATAQKADLAPRHYRIRPTGRHAAEGAFSRFRAPPGSDGALRLRPRARRIPPRRASSSRWRGSPPCRAGRGSPPAPGPPRRDAWPRCRRTSSAPPSHQ